MANKRILITGGAGFVGHHCVDHLLKNTDWETKRPITITFECQWR